MAMKTRIPWRPFHRLVAKPRKPVDVAELNRRIDAGAGMPTTSPTCQVQVIPLDGGGFVGPVWYPQERRYRYA